MKLKTLIVEDEPIASALLADYLSQIDWVKKPDIAADGVTAAKAIDDLHPDLVFLDIKLPGISGLQVLEKAQHRPALIFTTAHDEFALHALQAGALDYLLKPFGRQQFLFVMERARDRMLRGQPMPPDLERAREVFAARKPLERIFVHHKGEIVPIPLRDIHHVEACDDYVQLHLATGSYLAQVPIGEMEKLAGPQMLVRVHRSHLINLDHVALLKPYDPRRLLVVLKSGKEIIASRAGSKALQGLIV
jgi:two-component system, LytTR family, response regulator